MEGRICIRSSSNIYNQSLMASIIESHGKEDAKDWAAGIVKNMAREPQGGDTDQLRGIVSGECDIAVANTYYFARGLASDVDGLTSGIDGIGWVWPNQSGRGAHVNLAAAGIAANAPNKAEATALLEFLASEEAQAQFANANNEYPVMSGVPIGEHVAKMGLFIPTMIRRPRPSRNTRPARRPSSTRSAGTDPERSCDRRGPAAPVCLSRRLALVSEPYQGSDIIHDIRPAAPLDPRPSCRSWCLCPCCSWW